MRKIDDARLVATLPVFGFVSDAKVTFSPDGMSLAWFEEHSIRIGTWSEFTELRHQRRLRDPIRLCERVIFSPNGERIATFTRDDAIIWDTWSGRPLVELPGHSSVMRRRAVPVFDGRRLELPDWSTTFQRADFDSPEQWELVNPPCRPWVMNALQSGYRALTGRSKLSVSMTKSMQFWELVVTSDQSGETIAWYPERFGDQRGINPSKSERVSRAHPFAPVWAGAENGHLLILKLEDPR